jgi:tetratricopeptide (TPR) repeat protein
VKAKLAIAATLVALAISARADTGRSPVRPKPHSTIEAMEDLEGACADGKGDDAIKACTALVSSGRRNDRRLTWYYDRRSWLYCEEKRYALALSDIEHVLALEPDNAMALYERGLYRLRLGRFEPAVRDLDAALKLNPGDPLFLETRGEARMDAGDLTGALADLNDAIAREPPDGRLLKMRGDVYRFLGDYARAIADYDQAHLLLPADPWPFVGRGVIEGSDGQSDQALADFAKALAIDASRPGIYTARGNAYYHLRQYDLARRDFDTALKLDASDIYALYGLARLDMKVHSYEAALAGLDKAIALRPDFAFAYMGRTRVLGDSGEMALAMADLKTAEKLAPKDSDLLANISGAYVIRGKYDLALAVADRAVAAGPQDYGAYNERCWVRAVWGRDLDLALGDCTKGVSLHPLYSNTYGSRALVYLKQSKFASAVADCDAAVKLDPQDADAVYIRGRAKIGLGDKIGGEADIATAKAIDPGIADEYAKYGVTQ